MNILNTSEAISDDGRKITFTGRDAAGNPYYGTITVMSDQPPVAGADATTVTAGSTVSIDVLTNDTDPEGSALSITEATADNGSVSIVDALLSYTAPIGFVGIDRITYKIRDSAGNHTTGTVSIAVEAVNLPPEARDDVADAIAGETITIDVLANDVDAEDGTLTVITAGASYGTVVVNPDGTLSYTAPRDYIGTDTVGYTISDPAGKTAEGRVTVGINPVPNEPPIAADDTATVAAPGGTITIDVLVNDSDPEGGSLTVTEATATSGSVTVAANGTLTYTAPTGFSGVDTITYTIRDTAGNTDEGQVAVTVTPLQLIIHPQTAVGNFAVEAKTGSLTVTIIEPVDYAGTHVIQTADLQQGPINLVPPRIQGDKVIGSTMTVTSGIWASDETHGAIAFTQQWYRGSTAIAGATTDRYTIQSGDSTSGLSYSRKAANSAGNRSISVEAMPKEVPATQTFVERGVRFTNQAKLIRNADLAPSDSRNVLYFVSLIPYATGRHGILRQSSINNGVELWDGKFQLQAVNRVVNSRTLTAGQRANFLCTASETGTKTVLRLYSRFANESGWTEERPDDGGSGPVDLTFGGFSIGGRHGAIGHNLNATIYRIAFWSDVSVDLSDPAVFSKFLQADGTLVDPAVSRSLYGTPRVDLFGPAEDYAARINRGTAGNFDIVEGTFINA